MRTIFIALLFLPSFALAQVNDDFSDSDFSSNPVWTGTNSKWTVVNNQLRSNSTMANDTFYLTTPSTKATQAQWEFYVNLKFATSGTNYTDIYLVCDSANLKSANKTGYFVRVGNASDEICLYRRKNNTNTKIIDGANGQTNTSNNILKIKVTRNVDHVWTLKRDLTGTGLNYITEGAVIDSTFTTSAYIGVLVRQSTSSFHRKHFFDDMKVGQISIDNTPPTLVSAKVVSATQVDVLFNEYVDATTSQTITNYIVDNAVGNALSAVRDAALPNLVHLTFATPFSDSILNTLTISDVEDFDANAITSTSVNFTYYAPAKAIFKDIIINELFADPSPIVSLPDAEFVELYNRSKKNLNLRGWKLGDATGASVITSSTYTLLPNQYLIICADADTNLYKAYGQVLGMASFPSLNNAGDNMYLINDLDFVIDSVNYVDTWYKNTSKKEGGWTLELINTNSTMHCPPSENWMASNNPQGGTPGIVNSVNGADNNRPQLLGAEVLSADSVWLFFNEAVDTISLSNVQYYSINNGVGNPVKVQRVSTDSKMVLLIFSKKLQPGLEYVVSVNDGIKDCAGNTIDSGNKATFIIPELCLENDLVINEILADPKTDGVDFVEIYNRSNKIVDLKTIYISQFDTLTHLPKDKKIITSTSRLIYPNQYWVLSENSEKVKTQYTTTNPTGFITVKDLPTMNIASGAICLSTNENTIDQFSYNENMHFALLTDTKGVSLERIDFNRPTNDKTNWHSAAQAIGFATPAYTNSQYSSTTEPQTNISIYPELFSPDEDGVADVVTINYRFDEPGYLGNITIYDSKARLVKNLVRNELLGTTGSYSWDGINENKEKERIGMYVLYVEIFNLKGEVRQFKKVCVLGGKL